MIVMNVHAPTEDKSDDTKDSFYEELECVPHENFVRRWKRREKTFQINSRM